jgi:acylphosphatase
MWLRRVYRRRMKGIQAFYEGRVQGVGFRYCVRQLACGYEVTGWVKNLPDGRVELQACGEAEELEQFLTSIRESELKGHIRKEERHCIAPFLSKGFEIQR